MMDKKMPEGKGLDEMYSLSEKILLWVSKNEPVNSFEELLEKRGQISEETVKLNIERLHKANLIEGHLIKSMGDKYFVEVVEVKLTYAGMREVDRLLERKGGIKEMTLDLGVLKFKI